MMGNAIAVEFIWTNLKLIIDAFVLVVAAPVAIITAVILVKVVLDGD